MTQMRTGRRKYYDIFSHFYDAFIRTLVQRSANITVGYGFTPHTFMGPLISENARTRYRRYARALQGRGHNALLPAANEVVEPHRGFYVRPTIFEVSWENGTPFLNEEPPGPTLLVYKAGSWEEAGALHNQAYYRPVTSIFCRPDNPALPELMDMCRAGSINVNRGTLGSCLRIPRVGLGRSGNGSPEGLYLLLSLTYPRSFLLENRPFNASALVPGINWQGDGMADLSAPSDDILDLSETLESVAE